MLRNLFVPSFIRSIGSKITIQCNQPSRSIVRLIDLGNTYESLHDQHKHLSPLNGAVLIHTGALNQLYQHAQLDNSTATHQLMNLLFHEQGQFRTIQNKSYPAYSLTPLLLADIVKHLGEGTLDQDDVRTSIAAQWKKMHCNLAGEGQSISCKKINTLLDKIVASKQECLNKHYPSHLTETILLGFLYYKASLRQELLDFCSHTTKTPIQDKEIFSRESIKPIDEMIAALDLKNTAESETLLKQHYGKILLTLLLQNKGLEQVLTAAYGYKGHIPKPNCVEAAIHNLCNIFLFNEQIDAFDLSLLPETLNPNKKLIAFYALQDFQTDQVNSAKVGQTFMDLLSNHPSFLYSFFHYELSSDKRNFLPVMNYLFGSSANSLTELSQAFSNEKRTILFQEAKEAILITIKKPQLEPEELCLTLEIDHAELKAQRFNYNIKAIKANTLFTFALKNFNRDPCLLALLSQKEWEKQPHLFTEIDLLNSLVIYAFPKTEEQAILLLKRLHPFWHTYPHLKKQVSYILNQFNNLLFKLVGEHAYSDNLVLLNALFDVGANPNAISANGKTLLHSACLEINPIPIIQLLLKAGANPDELDKSGKTVLHCLVHAALFSPYNQGASKKIHSIEILIQAGADPHIADQNGKTVFHYLEDTNQSNNLATHSRIKELLTRAPEKRRQLLYPM
jgi:hypothetical protein